MTNHNEFQPTVIRQGPFWALPGLATAHSHAFQRLLRGRTQRQQTTAGSFWSWRGLMYDLAGRLDPHDVYQISRFAYAELAMSGVTAVGEFHYLHHDVDGRPYDNRTEMAEAVIRAALDVGLRICLIRTAYLRGGYGQGLEPAQRRFADPAVEPVLADVDTLRRRYAGEPLVTIGVAAHSVRAVPLPAIQELAAYSREHTLPFHMHVCEQRRELEEAVAEYGTTPVNLLAEAGVIDESFVAVHATHLDPGEIEHLGRNRALVCLCRTTERDLGDGLPPTGELVNAGARLCVGVDSHAAPDAFEELRAVELDERSRREARLVAAEAPALLAAGTVNGYRALGIDPAPEKDQLLLHRHDPALLGIEPAQAVDGVIFAATPRAVARVIVNGRPIVEGGRHLQIDRIATDFEKTVRHLDI